jgi:hypothetical protein
MKKIKEGYTEEEVNEIKKTFQSELARKDAEIERLRKENIVLLKTALKKAEKRLD